jgi:hypothetical protein
MLITELKKTTLPPEMGKILDFAPINKANHSEWIMLTEDGDLIRLNADSLDWK